MADKTEYSRLILKRSNTPGQVPTIPLLNTLDTFTDTDTFVGELFANVNDDSVFIRTNNGQIPILIGGLPPVSPSSLAATLLVGNQTGASDIEIDSNQVIRNPLSLTPDDAFISVGTSARLNEIRLKSEDLSTGQLALIVMDNNATGGVVNILTTDPITSITGQLTINSDGSNNNLYTLDDGVGTAIIIQTELSPAPNLTTIVTDGTSSSILTLTNGISDHTCDDGIEKTQIVVAPKLFQVQQFDIATLGLKTELKVEDDNISLSALNSLDPVSIQQIRNLRTTTTTTDATPTTVFTIPFLSGTSNINCKVKCFNAGITQGYAANLFAGFIFDGTTVTQLSTTDKVEKTTLVGATSDISFTGTDLIISVTGLAATTIDWVINIEIQ